MEYNVISQCIFSMWRPNQIKSGWLAFPSFSIKNIWWSEIIVHFSSLSPLDACTSQDLFLEQFASFPLVCLTQAPLSEQTSEYKTASLILMSKCWLNEGISVLVYRLSLHRKSGRALLTHSTSQPNRNKTEHLWN